MSDQSPKISVIVPTYNRSDYLLDTLLSLVQNSASPELFEIIVVDNNSEDNTQQAVASFIRKYDSHRISYVLEKDQGASHARNRGIAEADTSLLLFVDDDEISEPDLIENWLIFFEEHPQAVGGGGQIEVYFEDPRPKWMSHFLMPLLGEHKISSSVEKYGASQFPFAGNMAFRKSVFEEFGMLKTNLGRKGKSLLAGEEKEFYKRIREYTDKIYHVPDAKILHRVDRPRMTKYFIKKQALGLGRTISLMLEDASFFEKVKKLGSEAFKTAATLLLFLGYTAILQYPKAKMLVKFRWWIWKGYIEFTS